MGILLKGILIFALSLLILHQIYSKQPSYSGEQINSNPSYSNISIHRDQWGIPHIKGDTLRDAFYGSGYAHAQDRLWSMHVKRRAASGRLSQFGGVKTLATDKFFRTVGLRRIAIENVQNLDKEVLQLYQAYSEGINAYVSELYFLPLQFLLTGEKFELWTPIDSYSIFNLIAICMNMDYLFEPIRDLVQQKYGQQFAEEVYAAFGKYHIDPSLILDDIDLLSSGIFQTPKQRDAINAHKKKSNLDIPIDILTQLSSFSMIDELEQEFHGMKGSNNWVVHGKHTQSGYPILANDPHLDTAIPSTWYQVEYLYQDQDQFHSVIGVNLPGVPNILIGRSDYATWGVTNNVVDQTDLYYETIIDQKYYVFQGQNLPLTNITETIQIQGSEPLNLVVRFTHHGPLMENIIDLLDIANPVKMHQSLSLGWVGHANIETTLSCNIKGVQATNVQDLEKSFICMSGPGLSLVYATADKNIGYVALGRIPVRNFPEDIFIKNGQNKINDWVRFSKPEETPRVRNPEKGFIVTANNKMASQNLVNGFSMTQQPISRSYRITELIRQQIESKRQMTVQDMMEMQMDNKDSYAEMVQKDISKIYLKYKEKVFQGNQTKIQGAEIIFDYFNKWDCHLNNISVGATAFMVWEHEYLTKLFFDISDDQVVRNRATMNYMVDHFYIRRMKDWSEGVGNFSETWCVHHHNKHSQIPCIYNVVHAFYDSYVYLNENFGRDRENWIWSKIHTHTFIHAPFSDTPLQIFFERSYLGEGSRRTINVGGVGLKQGDWNAHFSPNFRMIVDMNPNGKSYYLIDTGVSQNVFSKHYDDQMPLHKDGKYIEMLWGLENLKKHQDIFYINSGKQQQNQQGDDEL